MFLDSDYKDSNRDFTLDKKNHADLPKLLEDTHKMGIRWNLIIDPYVEAYDYPSGKQYPPFTDGYKDQVYIKWDKSVPKEQRYHSANAPSDKDVIYTKGWPAGPIAVPDFFKTKTHAWFNRSLSLLHNDLGMKFDGLWIVCNTFVSCLISDSVLIGYERTLCGLPVTALRLSGEQIRFSLC